jgi:pyrroline-5-carboxylate reductase
MALEERRLAFIGAGHITSIIIDNLVKNEKVYSHRLIVSDPDSKKLQKLYNRYEIVMAEDNLEAIDKGDFVFINVLPQIVGDVLKEMRTQKFAGGKVIISIAAGIPIRAYDILGDRIPVVRALPNPPSQIGRGVVALTFSPHVTENQRQDIFELFSSFGERIVVGEENINAVMALTSPVLTYMFFQSLIDAGIRAGIDRQAATKIASRSISGSMDLWNRRQVPPYELISEASTPGGISVESLFALEKHGFKATILEAVDRAISKADALSRSVQRSG